jgi:hypothetical protein
MDQGVNALSAAPTAFPGEFRQDTQYSAWQYANPQSREDAFPGPVEKVRIWHITHRLFILQIEIQAASRQ